MLSIPIQVLSHARGLALPCYATPGAAGMDLRAALSAAIEISPGHRKSIPTGLKLAIPDGYEAQVRPRSGMAAKTGLTVLNAPGTVDSDYRGEIKVILINHGQEPVFIKKGQRIAQLVVAPVARVAWVLSDSLPDTSRGDGGFGSTGDD